MQWKNFHTEDENKFDGNIKKAIWDGCYSFAYMLRLYIEET
jgi:hypothetical protein